MRKLRAFVLRLCGFFRIRRSDDDFATELESHVALHTDEGVRVGQHDPVTIALICALQAVCGLIAALIPDRRAASIDPMEALCTE
jgi:hypothetical protein